MLEPILVTGAHGFVGSRVMEHCPHAIAVPGGLLRSLLQGESIRVSAKEHRGITYVRQVVTLLDRMAELPGGVYNYGSENDLTLADTARALLAALGLADAPTARIETTDRAEHPLWMDGAKLQSFDIRFDTTAEGFLRCAGDYGLR